MAKNKGNNIFIGILFGILLPLTGSYLLYYFTLHPMKIEEAILRLNEKHIHSQILTLVAFPNIVLFFAFIWANRLQTARGVVLATILYAAGTVLLKFV